MSGCHNPHIDMPVCEHVVPVKFSCIKCNRITFDSIIERINILEKSFVELMINMNKIVNKKPHKCPICEGSGGISHPLTGLVSPASCHACIGKGIICL